MGDEQAFKDNTPARQEQIAAAKLLLAVKLYSGPLIPMARRLLYAREDEHGSADLERFAGAVWDQVLHPEQNGLEATRKAGITHWLRGDDVEDADTLLLQIERATKAVGAVNADPEACQKLWAKLEARAR